MAGSSIPPTEANRKQVFTYAWDISTSSVQVPIPGYRDHAGKLNSIVCYTKEATGAGIDAAKIEVGIVSDNDAYATFGPTQLVSRTIDTKFSIPITAEDIPAGACPVLTLTTDASEAGIFYIYIEIGPSDS